MLRRIGRTTGAFLLVAVVVGVVVLSPLGLEFASSWRSFNWNRLSAIGQSYQAAAALLAALALCALAVSIRLQVRQTRVSQLQAARTMQLDLIRMAIQDPEYRRVLGQELLDLGMTRWKEHTYLNLWIMYLQMAYLTGAYDDTGIRRVLTDEFFNGASGLRYWPVARKAFDAEATTRRHRRFFDLVEAAYLVAASRETSEESSAVTAAPAPGTQQKITSSMSRSRLLLVLTLGVVIGRRLVDRSRDQR
jgi:hypothetical protein